MTFSEFSCAVAKQTGRPGAFAFALAAVALWAVSGPWFEFSETWQLVINTSTTIVTFLMVFLLQHTQNRDGVAVQAKLDELILATKDARNDLVKIEKTAAEEEIEKFRE